MNGTTSRGINWVHTMQSFQMAWEVLRQHNKFNGWCLMWLMTIQKYQKLIWWRCFKVWRGRNIEPFGVNAKGVWHGKIYCGAFAWIHPTKFVIMYVCMYAPIKWYRVISKFFTSFGFWDMPELKGLYFWKIIYILPSWIIVLYEFI